MILEIEKDFQFEAAHYFGHADANDLFKKVHGHSLRGTVTIHGDTQEEKGWNEDEPLWCCEDRHTFGLKGVTFRRRRQ